MKATTCAAALAATLLGACEARAQTSTDVYNIADHGADGTATNDDTAMQSAISYASSRQGTTIYIPQNINGKAWLFKTTALFTFQLPSNTTLKGAGRYGTTIAWDDANTNGYYLFGDVGTTSNPAQNISIEDLTFLGTWTLPSAAFPNGDFTRSSGGTALALGSVNGLTIRNVESDYSRGFGMSAASSVNVTWDNDVVNYAYADGISNSSVSNLLATNLKINHTNDDCFSAHNGLGDTWGVRRDLLISNIMCFDTAAIDISSPRHAIVENFVIESPKGHALSFDTATAGNGATQGNSATEVISVHNGLITNLINRAAAPSGQPASNGLDGYGGGGNTAITIDGGSARAGNLASVPGENTNAQTTIIDPYPQFMANSQSASVAVTGGHAISISDVQIVRTFPATNGSYTAPGASQPSFPNWEALGQGPITLAASLANPTLPENWLQGGCLDITNGFIHDMRVSDLTCSGMGYLANIVQNAMNGSTPVTGKFDLIKFNNVRGFDLPQVGLYIYVQSGGSAANVVVSNSDFDLDPYSKNTNRGGSGNWNSASGCTETVFCKNGPAGSLFAFNNTIKNSGNDTNVDTTDPTTGWEFRNNYDFAQINVPNAFSGNNNFGIGFAHPGFEVVPIAAIPGNPAYDTITSVKVAAASAEPTTGSWHQGDYVRNTAPAIATGSTLTIKGWIRITNGSSNAAGTDWQVDHTQ